MVTPNHPADEELFSVGTAGPEGDAAHFNYLLIDTKDPNPNNPQVIFLDIEEASVRFASRMPFRQLSGLLT
jgi:hypothetical protein